jgi:hypothetical protein
VTALTEESRVSTRAARARFLAGALLLGLGALWTIGYLGAWYEYLALDFRYAYVDGARAVLDGRTPYPPPDGPELATDTAYVYPPLLAFVVTPFTLLPEGAIPVVAAVVAGGLLFATLWILGVRDLRCYGACLLWAPTQNALYTASVSSLLAFGVALVWRYRNDVWPPALALGLTIALKLFLWPLAIWAAASGRLRATGWALAVAGAATLLTWGAIGFGGLADYPDLLRRLESLNAERSYSIVGVLAAVGVDGPFADALAIAIGVALIAGCAVLARRGDEVRGLALAIAGALALSPIVWQHYLVLLLVPLALMRPRFSMLWLLPIVLWLSPRAGHGAGLDPWLPLLVAVSILTIVLVRPGDDAKPLRSRSFTITSVGDAGGSGDVRR